MSGKERKHSRDALFEPAHDRAFSMELNAPQLPDPQAVTEAVNQWIAADSQLSGLLESGLTLQQALSKWATQLLVSNRIVEASSGFLAAVTHAPQDPLAWSNYGIALDRANSLVKAAECLSYSLALQQLQPETWLSLGFVRKKQGDISGAETTYLRALEQNPNSPLVLQCLGLLKEEQRDYPAAIHYLSTSTRYGEPSADLLANLGRLYYQTGRIAEANDFYARAVNGAEANPLYRQMHRKMRFLRDIIKGESVGAALTAYQDAFVPADRPSEKDLVELFNTGLGVLGGFGYLDAATQLGRKQLELWPDSPSVSYMLKAFVGGTSVDRSPPGYIVEHFDAFAEGFDAQLVGTLGYDIPEKLCAAVEAATPLGHRYEAVDAGCVTGLFGPLLRPFFASPPGVY